MSNHERVMALTAAILSTLLETDGSPESILYIGTGMDMDLWTKLRAVLVASNLVTINQNFVELTAKGRSVAEQCNAALAAR